MKVVISLILAALFISYYFPQVSELEWLLPYLLSGMLFTTFVKTKFEVKKLFKKRVLAAFLISVGLVPFIVVEIARIFNFSYDIQLGLFLIAITPTAMAAPTIAGESGLNKEVADPVTPAFTVGVDFGTSSVRAVVVDCADGRTLGTDVFDYRSGERGVLVDPRDPHLARQHPADYLAGLEASVRGALTAAEAHPGFARDRVIGIGTDTTGSTPLPVYAAGQPLGLDRRFRHSLAAQAWLWKDHAGASQAAPITEAARHHAPQYLAPIGGTYSSEWFWSKIWLPL